MVYLWIGLFDICNEGIVWWVKWKYGKWGKFEIKEMCNLWYYGKYVYDESCKDDVLDGVEFLSGGCMIDVDILLKG